jgi:hypothetical protein
MDLAKLFNIASGFAETYDGSEVSYRRFIDAAIAFDTAAKEPEKTSALLERAIRAVNSVNSEEDFLERLKRGGAQVFHHGAVFVLPNPHHTGLQNGNGDYSPPESEPRLRQVVMALQGRGVYFDDLIVDAGRVKDNQMRIAPYIILTIPRLNAQIAVADQVGEALFVAKPAIPFMNWALFEKKMAGAKGTAFEGITRVVHAGAWEERMISALFGDDPAPGPKVALPGYVKAHRKTKYPLTEEMVVAMARLWRVHPENKNKGSWPTAESGPIPRDIIVAVTGDADWQDENWSAIHMAGRQKSRGLMRSLSQTLDAHCPERGKVQGPIVPVPRPL